MTKKKGTIVIHKGLLHCDDAWSRTSGHQEHSRGHSLQDISEVIVFGVCVLPKLHAKQHHHVSCAFHSKVVSNLSWEGWKDEVPCPNIDQLVLPDDSNNAPVRIRVLKD